jgi:transposase InsO family protein
VYVAQYKRVRASSHLDDYARTYTQHADFLSVIVRRKCANGPSLFYSSSPKRKPGPKGPAPELIQAICELKQRNPRFGCPKIAQTLAKAFGMHLDKDVVRRILAAHYRPERWDSGPSWLTFLAHAKDSLWSMDLFRTESILLKTHWVLVIMDQFTRRIVGFGVQAIAVDGPALSRMFNQAISSQSLPAQLMADLGPAEPGNRSSSRPGRKGCRGRGSRTCSPRRRRASCRRGPRGARP